MWRVSRRIPYDNRPVHPGAAERVNHWGVSAGAHPPGLTGNDRASMDLILALAAVVLYVGGAGLIAARLYGGSVPPKMLAIGLAALAAVAHAWLLYPAMAAGPGLDMNFFHALSLVAWLCAVTVVLGSLLKPLESVGAVLFPIAAVMLVMQITLAEDPLPIALQSWRLDVHILISLLAYAMLTIAAVHALALAAQDRALRAHRPLSILQAMPPLRTMESLLFQLIGVGFALLTLALVTGGLFIQDLFAQHLVHKTVLATFSWLVFGTLLWGRWQFGWRGRVAIRWTLAGMGVLVLAYFGSKLVLELILDRVGGPGGAT